MKIGNSLSYCVLDIAKGLVDIDDVLVITARTRISNDLDFDAVIESYKRNYWMFDPNKCGDIARKLWNAGKIHQPRLMEYANPVNVSNEFNWFDVVPTGLSLAPVVQEAYDTYAVLLKLHTTY